MPASFRTPASYCIIAVIDLRFTHKGTYRSVNWWGCVNRTAATFTAALLMVSCFPGFDEGSSLDQISTRWREGLK